MTNYGISTPVFLRLLLRGGVNRASGSDAAFASLAHDVLNFVSDYHRGLTDGRIMPTPGMGSSFAPAASAADQDFTSYGFASHALIDHGVAHAALGVCKA